MRKNSNFIVGVLMALGVCACQDKASVSELSSDVRPEFEPLEQSPTKLRFSSIFTNEESLASAIADAENGDERSMAQLEEHYKQTYDISKAFHWQDELISRGSVLAMSRKAALLTGTQGPESCPEVISLLERAAAKANTRELKDDLSRRLAAMKGELGAGLSCPNVIRVNQCAKVATSRQDCGT